VGSTDSRRERGSRAPEKESPARRKCRAEAVSCARCVTQRTGLAVAGSAPQPATRRATAIVGGTHARIGRPSRTMRNSHRPSSTVGRRREQLVDAQLRTPMGVAGQVHQEMRNRHRRAKQRRRDGSLRAPFASAISSSYRLSCAHSPARCLMVGPRNRPEKKRQERGAPLAQESQQALEQIGPPKEERASAGSHSPSTTWLRPVPVWRPSIRKLSVTKPREDAFLIERGRGLDTLRARERRSAEH